MPGNNSVVLLVHNFPLGGLKLMSSLTTVPWSMHVNLLMNNFMLKGNRDETTTVDMAKAQKEAQDLFQVKNTKVQCYSSLFASVMY